MDLNFHTISAGKASTGGKLSVNVSDFLLSLWITLFSYQMWLYSDSTYWQTAMEKSITTGRRTKKRKHIERADSFKV